MASREFHGRLHNRWTSDLTWLQAEVDGGIWQDPWLPSVKAGVIHPGEIAEWRSESDGFMTGTSGWSLWSTTVGNHTEWITVGWDVPFLGTPDISAKVEGADPRITGNVFKEGSSPTLVTGQESFNPGFGGRGSVIDAFSYTVTIPVSWFVDDD